MTSIYRLRRLYDALADYPLARYAALRVAQGAGVRTLVVKMDTNWLCNLRCRTCHFSDPGEAAFFHKQMDPALFAKIAADIFPRTRSLALSCGAEPTMSPDFAGFVAAAGHYRVPHLSYVTNGIRLGDEVMEASIAHGVHEVIFSIDGASQEVYESIRVRGDFGTFRARVLRFRELRGGRPFPEFRFNFVALQRNIHELPALIDLAEELGVSIVNIRHLTVGNNMALDFRRESLVYARDRYDEMLDLARARAEAAGIELLAEPKFSEARPDAGEHFRRYGCIQPWSVLYIMPNGDYRPCLYLPPQGSFRDATYDELAGQGQMAERKHLIGADPRASCLNVCHDKRGVLLSGTAGRMLARIPQLDAIPRSLGLYGRSDAPRPEPEAPEREPV